MEQPLLVYTTFPDAETALAVGRALVADKLAACVNVLPGMRSVYAWKGEIEQGEEVVAIVKTRDGLRDAVAAALKSRHPVRDPDYPVPRSGGRPPGDPRLAPWGDESLTPCHCRA
jgi:periplasmic divalent cation tolerance protein